MIKSSLARLQCHTGFLYTSESWLVIALPTIAKLRSSMWVWLVIALPTPIKQRSLTWVTCHIVDPGLDFHRTWILYCICIVIKQVSIIAPSRIVNQSTTPQQQDGSTYPSLTHHESSFS